MLDRRAKGFVQIFHNPKVGGGGSNQRQRGRNGQAPNIRVISLPPGTTSVRKIQAKGGIIRRIHNFITSKTAMGYSRKNPHLPDGWHAGNSHGRGGRGLWKSRWEGGSRLKTPLRGSLKCYLSFSDL